MNRLKLKSRRSRERIGALKKAGIWIFLALFVFSIIGVTFVTGMTAR